MTEVLNKLKMRLPAILLLAATLLFWSNYDPCRPYGPVLLETATLADAAYVEGDCRETNSVFMLTRSEGGTIPAVGFKLPDVSNYRMLRLRGRLRAESVVPGEYEFDSARVTLVQRDKSGRVVARFDEDAHGSGTFKWTKFLNDYYVHRGVEQVEVLLTQQGQSGTALFDSVEVRPVRFKGRTHWIKYAFAAAWLILGIFYFPRCRLHTRKLRHLILLNVILILVGILLPTRVIQRGIHEMNQLISCVQVKDFPAGMQFVTAGPAFDLPLHFEDTVGRSKGHFILFGSLSFLVLLSGALEGQPRSYYFKVAFDVLLFGAITEALQYLTPDRTVDMADMLCNAYGMLTAMVLFIFVKTLWRNSARWNVGKTN
ncbi:VanZ family protein [Pontiellaceae bacterium B1224]|nr:VanZ family protein [Pontiellaceae bacterium B1224]